MAWKIRLLYCADYMVRSLSVQRYEMCKKKRQLCWSMISLRLIKISIYSSVIHCTFVGRLKLTNALIMGKMSLANNCNIDKAYFSRRQLFPWIFDHHKNEYFRSFKMPFLESTNSWLSEENVQFATSLIEITWYTYVKSEKYAFWVTLRSLRSIRRGKGGQRKIWY